MSRNAVSITNNAGKELGNFNVVETGQPNTFAIMFHPDFTPEDLTIKLENVTYVQPMPKGSTVTYHMPPKKNKSR